MYLFVNLWDMVDNENLLPTKINNKIMVFKNYNKSNESDKKIAH